MTPVKMVEQEKIENELIKEKPKEKLTAMKVIRAFLIAIFAIGIAIGTGEILFRLLTYFNWWR